MKNLLWVGAFLVTMCFYTNGVEAKVLLDDFEDGAFWTPDYSLGYWDSDGSAVYQRSHMYAAPLESNAMLLSVNKNGLPWSFFAGHIAMNNPIKDFSQHQAVRMKTNGTPGDAEILLKLRDGYYNEIDVETAKIGSVSGKPQNLLFDYGRYTNGAINLAEIDNILLFVDPGSTQNLGKQFYIDDIELVKYDVLSHFDNGISGGQLTWGSQSVGINFDYDTPKGARARTFIVNGPAGFGSNWASGYFFNGIKNMKPYRYLSFWARVKTHGAEATLYFNLKDMNGRQSASSAVHVLSSEWQRFEIDLGDFFFGGDANFDIKRVSKLDFNIVSNHNGVVVVSMDDILLVE